MLPFSPPGDLPDPGVEPVSPAPPALVGNVPPVPPGGPFHRLHGSFSAAKLSSSCAYTDSIFLFFPFSLVARNYPLLCCEFITKLK